jgi:hypothetical protein
MVTCYTCVKYELFQRRQINETELRLVDCAVQVSTDRVHWSVNSS